MCCLFLISGWEEIDLMDVLILPETIFFASVFFASVKYLDHIFSTTSLLIFNLK